MKQIGFERFFGGPMNKKIDILQHVLVPAYKVLTPEETEAIITQHGIKMSNLPKIFLSDPIIKKINAKIGDVLEITRKSLVTGTAKHYRVVVDG